MGCMKEYQGNSQICPHCGYDKREATSNSYHLLPETILQGRYIVGKVLGVGGFGITYIGYDAELERIVAIKEFLPSMFATRISGEMAVSVYQGEATNQYTLGLKRFVDEARTLAQFNGIPGIVDIYDSFTSNNTAYIIMQYLKGVDVKHILKAQGPLDYETARSMILSICDTLEPVHAKGIIHRDISPDNIFVTDEGEIKLLDFGAARYESAVNSKSLSVILKKGFAPEEQYRSRGEQGGWTDVYALAATFYKMLTGITPQDSMERSIQDDLRLPSDLGIELPINVQAALIKALGVRKQDRTQSIQAFKQDLMDDGLQMPKEIKHTKKAQKAKEQNSIQGKLIIGIAVFTVIAIIAVLVNQRTTSLETSGSGLISSLNLGVEDALGEMSPTTVTVPNIEGMTYEQAKATLEELGLGISVSTCYFGEPKDEHGSILYQVPDANTSTTVGKEILVGVDVGDPYNAVEIGYYSAYEEMPLDELLEIMDDSSNWSFVRHSINYEFSSEEEKDRLLRIEYYEGSGYYSRSEYVVTIGLGPEE